MAPDALGVVDTRAVRDGVIEVDCDRVGRVLPLIEPECEADRDTGADLVTALLADRTNEPVRAADALDAMLAVAAPDVVLDKTAVGLSLVLGIELSDTSAEIVTDGDLRDVNVCEEVARALASDDAVIVCVGDGVLRSVGAIVIAEDGDTEEVTDTLIVALPGALADVVGDSLAPPVADAAVESLGRAVAEGVAARL